LRLKGKFTFDSFAEFSSKGSYVQFWDRGIDWQELQGTLRSFRSELVVLSTCRTAIGDAELGFAGLAVRLGAKRVIASLRYVEDEPTLRQVQINMIRGNARIENGQLVGLGYNIQWSANLRQDRRQFSHSFYWVGFNMIGNSS